MEATLSEYWMQRLEQFVLEKSGGKSRRPSATDFSHAVELKFPDGSLARFRFAFHLLDAERNEVAVFTEHCGYHIFPAESVEISTLTDRT